MRFEQKEDLLICYQLNDFPPFEEERVGAICKNDDGFYRFRTDENIFLNCGTLQRIAYKLSQLNSEPDGYDFNQSQFGFNG